MNKTQILLILPALIIVMSCKEHKKTDPNPAPAPTQKQLLTAKPWKLTAATVEPALSLGGGPASNDLYAQMAECERDNIYKYVVLDPPCLCGELIRDENALKCNPSDPQLLKGFWTLYPENSRIVEGGNRVSSSFFIMELTSSTFKRALWKEINDTAYYFQFTLTAQG